jgi:hypothetical protein
MKSKPLRVVARFAALAPIATSAVVASPAARAATIATWSIDAGGNWSNPANWDAPNPVRESGGVPNGIDSTARFVDTLSAPRVVTVDAPVTLGQIQFQARHGYTLAGPGEITLRSSIEGFGGVVVINGSHTIAAPLRLENQSNNFFILGSEQTLTISGQLSAAGRTINIAALDCAVEFRNLRAGALNVANGTTRITPDGTPDGASRLGSISLGNESALDLTDNDLQITGGNTYAEVAALIGSGLHGGGAAPGSAAALISSTAAADPARRFALGTLRGSEYKSFGGRTTFDGFAVGDGDVLVKYTLAGDATLDGAVDFKDLAQLAQNYNMADGAREWSEGDFNYDGKVDFNDLVTMVQNYNTALPANAAALAGAGAAFEADFARAAAEVPEPAPVALMVAGAAVALLRRRARRRRPS